jgi:hypothetical protein
MIFSIPLTLLKVNPIEIKYRNALKDEELKHATFVSSFYGNLLLVINPFLAHPLPRLSWVSRNLETGLVITSV